MIDWRGAASAAIWILGLGILLATVSVAYANAETESVRRILGQSGYRLALCVGMMLFVVGMILSVGTWWERAGWVVVLGLLAWDVRSKAS